MEGLAQAIEVLEDKSKLLHDLLRSNSDDRTTDGELQQEIWIAQIDVLDEMIAELKLIQK